jgi:tetratricopeptide (TPR) repeat protein
LKVHRYQLLLGSAVWLASTAALAAAMNPGPTSASQAEVLERAPSPEAVLAGLPPEKQGDLLMARGSYAAALEAYQHGSLQSAVTWNKMGIAYHHLFALEEARKHYEVALTLNPHYAEALNNLAAVYHGEHNYKQAEKTYKKALKYAPNMAVTYRNLGTTYVSDQKFKQAAQAFQKALTLNQNVFDTSQNHPIEDGSSRAQRAAVNYYMAKTQATAGNKEQALIYLRRALEAGFNDRRRIMEDKDFAQLRSTPEFQQMMEQLHEIRVARHVTG